MWSRLNRPRLRRAGLASVLAVGFALVATGMQGLAGVDDRLEAASERRDAVQVEGKWRDGDCPRHRDALPERESL